MPYYLLDTSALVKYYHPEKGSAKVIALADDPSNILFISRISLVEIHSSFAKKVRVGEITVKIFQRLRKRFFADLRARRFRIVRLTPLHERQAISLIVKYGVKGPVRTLDALQLAVAVWLRDQQYLDQFVCADVKLCTAAQWEAFTVLNPEVP